MKYVLDTSVYSAFNRGDVRVRGWFRSGNEILVPLIVVGELRVGFAAGTRRAENEALLQRFLDAPNVGIVGLTDMTAILYAEIYRRLREAGKPIGANDIWIAAVALEADGLLMTLDADFANVPDLMLAKFERE